MKAAANTVPVGVRSALVLDACRLSAKSVNLTRTIAAAAARPRMTLQRKSTHDPSQTT